MLINLEQSDPNYFTEDKEGNKQDHSPPKFIVSIIPEKMITLLLN